MRGTLKAELVLNEAEREQLAALTLRAVNVWPSRRLRSGTPDSSRT